MKRKRREEKEETRETSGSLLLLPDVILSRCFTYCEWTRGGWSRLARVCQWFRKITQMPTSISHLCFRDQPSCHHVLSTYRIQTLDANTGEWCEKAGQDKTVPWPSAPDIYLFASVTEKTIQAALSGKLTQRLHVEEVNIPTWCAMNTNYPAVRVKCLRVCLVSSKIYERWSDLVPTGIGPIPHIGIHCVDPLRDDRYKDPEGLQAILDLVPPHVTRVDLYSFRPLTMTTIRLPLSVNTIDIRGCNNFVIAPDEHIKTVHMDGPDLAPVAKLRPHTFHLLHTDRVLPCLFFPTVRHLHVFDATSRHSITFPNLTSLSVHSLPAERYDWDALRHVTIRARDSSVFTASLVQAMLLPAIRTIELCEQNRVVSVLDHWM